MSRPVTLYHGLSSWAWEVVQHQGRLRASYTAQDGERLYKVVEDRGFVYFCADPDIAAVYAGNPTLRFTWWAKGWPTPVGLGRWTLPGIASQNGVVIAGEFDPGEVTLNRRPNSHDEHVTDRPVTVDRLRVVAYIPRGSKVTDALGRAEQPPPLPVADRERLKSIDKDGEIAWPGPLISDVAAAQRPLRYLRSVQTRKAREWQGLARLPQAGEDHPSPSPAQQRIPPIGSPPQLLPSRH